jgi:hypothetical protein
MTQTKKDVLKALLLIVAPIPGAAIVGSYMLYKILIKKQENKDDNGKKSKKSIK